MAGYSNNDLCGVSSNHVPAVGRLGGSLPVRVASTITHVIGTDYFQCSGANR